MTRPVARRGVAAAGLLLALSLASPLAAQRLRLTAFGAGSQYREQTAALSFDGKGFAGRLDLAVGRLGLTVTGSRLDFSESGGAAHGLEPFELAEIDAAARLRLVSVVSIEVGGIRRWATPELAAQSFRAARIGLRGDYGIAAGADASLRAGALGGASFSGGGTADLGLLLGFGLSYGARDRGVRLTIDYEFLRLDRETAVPGGPARVPIQSSTARLGLMLQL
ncbi:MAG: hypothetical protein AB7R55_13080 [Gemmatimonadales bacterium]